MFIFKVAYLYW